MVFRDLAARSDIKLSTIDTGGDDDVLLLIHGIMMSKEVWYKQIDYFSNNFRVVAVDLYGFGESTGSFRDSTNENHAADLKTLLDELSINSIHILGWSMGGAIAMVFAHLYPSYLKSMILVDTTPQLIATSDFPHAIQAENAAKLLEKIETAPHEGIIDFANMIFPEKNCEEEVARITKIALISDLDVVLAHFSQSGLVNLRGILSSIKIPTLVICGELDSICSPLASEYMVTNIQDSQLQIIEEAGHAPFLTISDEFNLRVHDFLTGKVLANRVMDPKYWTAL